MPGGDPHRVRTLTICLPGLACIALCRGLVVTTLSCLTMGQVFRAPSWIQTMTHRLVNPEVLTKACPVKRLQNPSTFRPHLRTKVLWQETPAAALQRTWTSLLQE